MTDLRLQARSKAHADSLGSVYASLFPSCWMTDYIQEQMNKWTIAEGNAKS